MQRLAVEPVEDESPRGGFGVVSRVAAGAVSVPVVLGFVLLGAVVVVGREVRHLLRGRVAGAEPEPVVAEEGSRRSQAA